MIPAHRTKRRRSAFTLVELVVVITILAILGTIGFLSVGGYSSRARDSGRLADVANVSKSLDLAIVTMGSYPMPDGYFSVTYSGSAVWYQGTVGTTVLQAFRSSVAGGGLSKKPADPLDGGDYAYSSLAEGKAYQVEADYEGDVATSAALAPSLAETAYAAPGAPAVAYIRGNYGGIAAKVSSGSTVYVLALPSIVTNTGAAAGSSVRIDAGNSLSGTLLVNGKALRNANPYNPGAAYALAYSGTKSVANPGGLPSGQAEYAALVASLKAAYSGSAELQANSAIAGLLSSTGTTAMAALGSAIVSGQLGGGNWNGTDGSLVSGNCTGLPGNAVYFNNSTSYSVSSAVTGTSLSASGVTTPLSNTCQFKCNSGYSVVNNTCMEVYKAACIMGTSAGTSYIAATSITNKWVCIKTATANRWIVIYRNSNAFTFWWGDHVPSANWWLTYYWTSDGVNFNSSSISDSLEYIYSNGSSWYLGGGSGTPSLSQPTENWNTIYVGNGAYSGPHTLYYVP